MTDMTTQPRPSLPMRALYAVPLIGWVAKDISRDVENAYYAVVILITLEVLAVMTWGLVALTMTALCMVPVMFAVFVYICWPFPPRK